MTVSYNLATLIGKIRLKIGDNIISDPVFTDEELQVFLDDNSNNVLLSSADAAEAWAGKYAANADNERIGDYSYAQSIVDKMLALAKRLREQAGMVGPEPAMDWASMNLIQRNRGINEL